MAQKMSTGLCNALLDGQALNDIFNLGFLRFFDGVPPALADDAEVGTPIIILTVDDDGVTGLTFDTPAVDGVISKNPSENWQGTSTGGTITHWRLVAPGDTGGSSTTEPRGQGTFGTGGADILTANTTIAAAVLFTLLAFTQSFKPN